MAEGDTASIDAGGLAGRVDELERRLQVAEERSERAAEEAKKNRAMLRAIAQSNGSLSREIQALLAG